MFSDADIQSHLGRIGLTRGERIANYHSIGIRNPENPNEGLEPRIARLKREFNEKWTMKDAGGNRPGRYSRVRFERISPNS